MPRLPRIYIEGALYYITSRGDYSHNIFIDRQDYKMFLDLLKKYKDQYGFKLYAYVFLPNHFHLLLELHPQEKSRGGISEIMHDLNSSYTKYFNAKYNRKGHLFQERFKAALVEKAPYLLRLTAYIHANPQRLNLVSNITDYPYSSYIFYIDEEVPFPDLIKEGRQEVLSLLPNASYLQFMEEVIKEVNLEFHKELKKGILGSTEFKDKIKQILSSYTKESREKNGIRALRKLGIVTVVIISVGFGLSYVLKISLKTKSDKFIDLKGEYKIPEQMQDLIKDLENTEWVIRLVSTSGGSLQNDVIHFNEGKFHSENLVFKGYSPAEYSLVIEDRGKVTWESRMKRGSQGMAYWRGEILKNQMRGTLTIYQKGLENRDFSFISVGLRKRPEVTPLKIERR